MKKSKKVVKSVANRNASITVRHDKNGKKRTETTRRDLGAVKFAASTNSKTNSTMLFIDFPEGTIKLSGAESRTLYRVLNKHYFFTGKTVLV